MGKKARKGITANEPPVRYIKLTTLEQAQGPEIHGWIEQAGLVPGWK
jgi:hypothetical protein